MEFSCIYNYNYVLRFELLIPKKWKGESRPLYIHMAGTGDHVRTMNLLYQVHIDYERGENMQLK